MRFAFFAIVALLTLLSPKDVPSQQVDYQCLSDCQARGYLYRFCRDKCSFGEDAGGGLTYSPPPPRRIDYNCQSDCLRQGYRLQYCQELCSY